MRYANLAMSLAAACVAAFAGAQQGIGHPAMADAERAESIERAFLDRVAAARGMKYYTKSTYVSDPPSAALWSFSSDSTMVMSGGLFRFEQPGIVLVAEPESLTMVNLQGQNYGRLDRPAPSEMLGSISMLSFGQADDIWLLHLAGDPEGGVAMMLDSTAYEGITEAPLDDRPGTWVFKTTTLGGDQVRERAWFDAETGLPARYEMDVTDLWAEFIPDGMFGTEPPTLTRVRQIESLEWLDAAPEPAAFELALAGLEPMDTSYFEYWQEMMANGTADEDGDSAGALHGLNEPQLSLVNQPAPSFELPILPADDAAAQVSEELRSLEDYRGRVVVLDFWASWCGPCLRAMPELEAVSTSFADRPVAFIGINSDSPDQYEAALEAVERTGVTFAQLADASDAVGRAYGVTGIPCTVVIDAEGVVRDVHVGYSPDLGAQLTATVETLLSGGSVHDEAMVESLASARRESAERRRAPCLEVRRSCPRW
ncbi:MAG: TlpA disulfide reductase family protein [Planctomycetota bacterium]